MPFLMWGLENIRLIQSGRCAVGCLVRVLSAGLREETLGPKIL